MESAAQSHWRLRRMHTTLAACMDKAQHSKRMRVLAGKAVRAWQHSILSTAFRAWEAHMIQHRESKEKITAALKHWQEGALTAAFTAWAEWAPEHAQIRQKSADVVLRWHHSLLSAAFMSWAEWAPPAAQRRQRATSALARLRNRQLASAFDNWRANAAAAADEREVTISPGLFNLISHGLDTRSSPKEALCHIHCIMQRHLPSCTGLKCSVPCSGT